MKENTNIDMKFAIVAFVIAGIIMLLSTIGNSFILVVTAAFKNRRLSGDWVIVVMALINLFITNFILPSSMQWTFLTKHVHFSSVNEQLACIVWLCIYATVIQVSTVLLCLSVLDIYFQSEHQDLYGPWMTSCKMCAVLGITGAVCITQNWWAFFTDEEELFYRQEEGMCFYSDNTPFLFSQWLVNFAIPGVILIGMVYTLYSRRKINDNLGIKKPVEDSTFQGIFYPDDATFSLKVVLALTLCFWLFWSPFWTYLFLYSLGVPFSFWGIKITLWIGYINCAAFPLVHILFNMRFRSVVMNILRRRKSLTTSSVRDLPEQASVSEKLEDTVVVRPQIEDFYIWGVDLVNTKPSTRTSRSSLRMELKQRLRYKSPSIPSEQEDSSQMSSGSFLGNSRPGSFQMPRVYRRETMDKGGSFKSTHSNLLDSVLDEDTHYNERTGSIYSVLGDVIPYKERTGSINKVLGDDIPYSERTGSVYNVLGNVIPYNKRTGSVYNVLGDGRPYNEHTRSVYNVLGDDIPYNERTGSVYKVLDESSDQIDNVLDDTHQSERSGSMD